MSEEFAKGIRELPRDREVIDMLKKISGVEALAAR